MLPTQYLTESNGRRSHSNTATNDTVSPLVRSFKVFASYKYTYWQYTVSQQHEAAIDRKFQSQPCTAARKLHTAVQNVLSS